MVFELFSRHRNERFSNNSNVRMVRRVKTKRTKRWESQMMRLKMNLILHCNIVYANKLFHVCCYAFCVVLTFFEGDSSRNCVWNWKFWNHLTFSRDAEIWDYVSLSERAIFIAVPLSGGVLSDNYSWSYQKRTSFHNFFMSACYSSFWNWQQKTHQQHNL